MAMGRPRKFDLDEAELSALRVFMAKGYEGASTAELAAAMRIKSPSLYAAFGSKEGLFIEALASSSRARAAAAMPACRSVTSSRDSGWPVSRRCGTGSHAPRRKVTCHTASIPRRWPATS